MPIPGGKITTSEIWNPKPELEDAPLPDEPTEVEQKELTEEEKLEIAIKIQKGEL